MKKKATQIANNIEHTTLTSKHTVSQHTGKFHSPPSLFKVVQSLNSGISLILNKIKQLFIILFPMSFFFRNFVKPVAIMTKKREKNIGVFMLETQPRSAGLLETSSRENIHIAKWYAFIDKEFWKLSCLGINGYFHENKSYRAILTNCVHKKSFCNSKF